MRKSLEKLARYGGFDLLETSIEGVQNINPDRKARRKIFLTEKGKEKERENFEKKRLSFGQMSSVRMMY